MVNRAELAGGDTGNHHVAVDYQSSFGNVERAGAELRLMAYFVSNRLIINKFDDRIHCLYIVQLDGADVLLLVVVAL